MLCGKGQRIGCKWCVRDSSSVGVGSEELDVSGFSRWWCMWLTIQLCILTTHVYLRCGDRVYMLYTIRWTQGNCDNTCLLPSSFVGGGYLYLLRKLFCQHNSSCCMRHVVSLGYGTTHNKFKAKSLQETLAKNNFTVSLALKTLLLDKELIFISQHSANNWRDICSLWTLSYSWVKS